MTRTTHSQCADFLLFIPTQAPGLHAVLSYYQSAAQLTSEGDVSISDEAIQGLGTTLDFLKTSAFGAITSLVRPPNPSYKQLPPAEAASRMVADASQASQLASAGFHDVEDEEVRLEADPHIPIKPARRKLKLTDLVPDVGYFVAGGVSGITSRTVTAPLDRLKVYLIAQTTNTNDAVQAAKSGAPVQAGRQGVRTLVNACKDLWAAGGIRSLFAGEFLLPGHIGVRSDDNIRQRNQCHQSHARIGRQIRVIRGMFYP
jgi:solute carrier family 25 phosphate transporter 23/24/25/41